MFLRIHALDLADTLYGTLLEGVAAQGIGGIGGIDYHASSVQDVQYAVYVALAGILLIQSYQHVLSFI